MKKYLLLRDNRQSGPYTLEEFTELSLRPQDLIWVEETGRSWQHPDALPELAPLVREESFEEREARRLERCTSAPAEPAEPEFLPAVTLSPDLFPERLRSIPTRRLPVWKKQLLKTPSGVLNMFGVFICVLFFALIMKKMVDSFTVGPNNELPVAYSVTDSYEARQNEDVQHALQRELVPGEENSAHLPTPVTDKPKDIKHQIRIKTVPPAQADSAAKFQIRVYNGSPHFVEKLTIRVDFLEGDSIVGSRKLLIPNLKSKGEKTVEVPPVGDAPKTKVRVTGVYSHEYKEALKSL